ncbi:MAG: site-specific DNA-methyltransferase [Chitinispirillales bacterium]|nr:site-specific DNA-methyltransferase [Chitinispirillales bacterium]
MHEKIDGLSMDIELAEQDKLRLIFPQCFVDGKLDVTKLLAVCGQFETVDENNREKYEFRWKGKQECLQLAGKRSAAALRPCVEESVNWDSTQNIYIEGDNLEVLKLLQTAYYRKVKMIYIDPPYNTGNDFVYEDDFADPLARYREITQQTTKSNPESMGRFHTNWLNMMYPRLRLAANLLRDDGVIFISIDDNEAINLRKICDEVFGEENHLGTFIWKRRQMVDSRSKTGVSEDHEYLLCYSKHGGRIRGKSPDMSKYSNPDNDPKGDWMSADMTGLATASQRPNLHYDLTNPVTGITYKCSPTGWRYEKSRMQELIEKGEVIFPKEVTGRPRRKKYVKDLTGEFAGFSTVLDTVFNTQATRELRTLFDEQEYFDFPKPVDLVKLFVEQGAPLTEDKEPFIVLDFFSGSATTAHAVMQLNSEDGGNRRFIMVQLPERCDEKSEAFKAGYKNICEIGKERIRRAGEKIKTDNPLTTETLDIGFRVFKLDSSNLKLWDDSPITGENALAELEARIRGMLDIIKPDRSNMDVVYEVMLKLGQELSTPIMPININGKTVYGVSVGEEMKFIVCLAQSVTPEDAEAMAKYAPGRIIFADACFENSEQKSNVRLTLRDKGIGIKTL